VRRTRLTLAQTAAIAGRESIFDRETEAQKYVPGINEEVLEVKVISREDLRQQ